MGEPYLPHGFLWRVTSTIPDTELVPTKHLFLLPISSTCAMLISSFIFEWKRGLYLSDCVSHTSRIPSCSDENQGIDSSLSSATTQLSYTLNAAELWAGWLWAIISEAWNYCGRKRHRDLEQETKKGRHPISATNSFSDYRQVMKHRTCVSGSNFIKEEFFFKTGQHPKFLGALKIPYFCSLVRAVC